MSIIDLHCDLLGSVVWSEGKLNVESEETNCSLHQLKEGGVHLQVMAVAAITGFDPLESGHKQVEIYREMIIDFPERIGKFSERNNGQKKIFGLFAIENASVLADDNEPFSKVSKRLDAYSQVEKILYVSLTWNGENRFGGGNETNVGLKEDGKRLLELLSERSIAVDFSHTCDRLAEEIFDYIDHKHLPIAVMASHSNFRAVKDHPRNLPDELAQEIAVRGGVIGINFIKRFLGEKEEAIVKHLSHGIKLIGEKNLCLGADFYGAIEIPGASEQKEDSPYYPDYASSRCYPRFRKRLEKEFSQEFIEALFFQNAARFCDSSVVLV